MTYFACKPIEKDNSKKGRKNRASGKAFELEVRKELQMEGWVVCKWTNQVEFIDRGEDQIEFGEIVPAKAQYNPFFKRIVGEGSGFPDFVIFRLHPDRAIDLQGYNVCGVEVKSNGYLTQLEKRKCRWLLENHIFNKIFIAFKGKDGIEYEEFK